VYKTTARNLDHIRDHFTFSTESILTYQLGSVGIQAEPVFPLFPSHDDLKRQEQRLLKMQQLCLLFQERITALEATLAKDPFSSTSNSNTTTSSTHLEEPNHASLMICIGGSETFSRIRIVVQLLQLDVWLLFLLYTEDIVK